MESSGSLDIESDLGIFALHYIFVDRINKQLEDFKDGWDSHKLTSEKCYTPNQLWIQGLHELALQQDSRIAAEIWQPANDVSIRF